MSANTIEITDANFDAEVAKSTVPVLIDFWRTETSRLFPPTIGISTETGLI